MAKNNLVFVTVLLASCNTFRIEREGGAGSVADAEIAFAHIAQVRTVNEAFVAAFAPDGILFRPTPVHAQQSLRERPIPAEALLRWTPTLTETSATNDLAVSTGPSERGTRGPQPNVSGTGYFLSVWRSDGSKWQVAIDAGVSTTIPTSVEAASTVRSIRTLKPSPARSDDIEQMRGDLLHIERQLIEDYPALLREHGASDLRLYRDEKAPTATLSDALNIASNEGNLEWIPTAAFVSKAGDLGYVYGVVKGAARDHGYMRIYRNQDARWRVAYDTR